MKGLTTGQLLRLKPGIYFEYEGVQYEETLLPVWEIGYSNLTCSNTYYDCLPLAKYSPDSRVWRHWNHWPFFFEALKEDLTKIFDLLSQEELDKEFELV